MRRVSPTPTYTVGNWILDGKNSGGAVLDLHIHDTDFVSYLLGKPKAVYSTGTVDRKQGPGSIVTQYIYSKPVSVSAEGGWNYPSAFAFEMSFVAVYEKAAIEYNSNKNPALVIYHSNGRKEIPKVPSGTGYSEEIAYFMNCVARKLKPTVTTAVDARNSVAIIEAENKSLESGKIVSIR